MLRMFVNGVDEKREREKKTHRAVADAAMQRGLEQSVKLRTSLVRCTLAVAGCSSGGLCVRCCSHTNGRKLDGRRKQNSSCGADLQQFDQRTKMSHGTDLWCECERNRLPSPGDRALFLLLMLLWEPWGRAPRHTRDSRTTWAAGPPSWPGAGPAPRFRCGRGGAT